MENLRGFVHPLTNDPLFSAGHLEAETHILFDRHVRVERIGLEHHGDAALGRLEMSDVEIADCDPSAGCIFQPGDKTKKGRLSAA